MKTIIIVPTYNEKENIRELVPAIFAILPDVSVMVVDDNSPDGTGEEVRKLQGKYPSLELLSRRKKDGLGESYITAFKKVIYSGRYEKVIMMDGDFSHDPKYLPEMIRYGKYFPVVVGSRYVKGGATVGWEFRRRLLSRFGNLYARYVTNLPVKDLTGGFNCIDMEFLKKIDLERLSYFKGYAFIMSLKYFLWKKRAVFKEIPIVFKNRTEGKSKLSNHIIAEGFIAPWLLLFSLSRKKKNLRQEDLSAEISALGDGSD